MSNFNFLGIYEESKDDIINHLTNENKQLRDVIDQAAYEICKSKYRCIIAKDCTLDERLHCMRFKKIRKKLLSEVNKSDEQV